ncbi:MAG: hypothetical protein LBJ59_11960 [Zoogloeaceae bacterium]|jgi:hypothetical protein|nr:hypothetical protein [Zoogloeaceae bacterium]
MKKTICSLFGQAAEKIFNISYPNPGACPYETTESKRQAAFYRNTGIWCPKPAREFFEFLMDRYSLTVKQLKNAWSAGAVAWDIDEGVPIVRTMRVANIVVKFFVCFLMFYFVLLVLYAASFLQHGAVYTAFMTMAVSLFCVMWVADNSFFRPRRTALRVQKIIDQNQVEIEQEQKK